MKDGLFSFLESLATDFELTLMFELGGVNLAHHVTQMHTLWAEEQEVGSRGKVDPSKVSDGSVSEGRGWLCVWGGGYRHQFQEDDSVP